jgi:uncharacterized protein (UPF0548 family)
VADRDLTYPEVGASASGALPAGYRHDRHALTIGPASQFENVAKRLRQWGAHAGAGMHVVPDQEVRTSGPDHLIMKLAAIWVVAPVRIVYVVDEADRGGFAYGTLPGHPEAGEESFVVERRGDCTEIQVVAFSKPSELLARMGSPVTRAVQLATTRRYLGRANQVHVEPLAGC